jgi:hypothetical protein
VHRHNNVSHGFLHTFFTCLAQDEAYRIEVPRVTGTGIPLVFTKPARRDQAGAAAPVARFIRIIISHCFPLYFL